MIRESVREEPWSGSVEASRGVYPAGVGVEGARINSAKRHMANIWYCPALRAKRASLIRLRFPVLTSLRVCNRS